jgi:hypothetical protein
MNKRIYPYLSVEWRSRGVRSIAPLSLLQTESLKPTVSLARSDRRRQKPTNGDRICTIFRFGTASVAQICAFQLPERGTVGFAKAEQPTRLNPPILDVFCMIF